MQHARSSVAMLSAVALLATGTTSSLAAQATATEQRNWVTVVQLKPDMVDEWLDLQRNEVIPAQKKAGVPWRAILRTRAGNGYEFTIIQPLESWAKMDGPGPTARGIGEAAAARLDAKLRKCIQSVVSYEEISRPDLTVQWGEAPIIRMVERRVNVGQMPAYLDHWRTAVMPAMQQAKAAGHLGGGMLTRRGVGAQFGQVVAYTMYKDFASLDAGNPFLPGMGQAAYNRMADAGNKLATTQRVRILIFQPDVSMVPTN